MNLFAPPFRRSSARSSFQRATRVPVSRVTRRRPMRLRNVAHANLPIRQQPAIRLRWKDHRDRGPGRQDAVLCACSLPAQSMSSSMCGGASGFIHTVRATRPAGVAVDRLQGHRAETRKSAATGKVGAGLAPITGPVFQRAQIAGKGTPRATLLQNRSAQPRDRLGVKPVQANLHALTCRPHPSLSQLWTGTRVAGQLRSEETAGGAWSASGVHDSSSRSRSAIRRILMSGSRSEKGR